MPLPLWGGVAGKARRAGVSGAACAAQEAKRRQRGHGRCTGERKARERDWGGERRGWEEGDAPLLGTCGARDRGGVRAAADRARATRPRKGEEGREAEGRPGRGRGEGGLGRR